MATVKKRKNLKGQSNIKCPYAVHRKEDLISRSLNNGEGNSVLLQQFDNRAFFADCLQENCGAYRNGRCHYKG